MDCLVDRVQQSTIVEVLRYRAQHQPTQVGYRFLVDGETQVQSVTYQDLDAQAQAIAAHLQAHQAQGTRVLLLYPQGLEFIAAFLGCLYAGMIAVPAYLPRPNQNGDRLQAVIADAQATLALTTKALMPKLQQQLSSSATSPHLVWLATDAIDVSDDQSWQPPILQDETLALLQYTSGSTGRPKGVMITHGNLRHNSKAIQSCFQDGDQSVGVSWLPLYHDMGLIGGILQPLFMGCSMVLLSPLTFLQKPVRWLQAISQYQATTSGGPNFAYDLCVAKITASQCETLDLSHWTVAFNGAEPLRAQTLTAFAEKFKPYGFQAQAFCPCYGMAEATLMIAGKPKPHPPKIVTLDEVAFAQNTVVAVAGSPTGRQVVSCGRAAEGQTLAIADPITLTRLPAQQVGEIWVTGASTAQGYWQHPDETQTVFQAYLQDSGEGPFLRTGDLGFLDNGELFVTGRLKELIIIRGQNHYPQDLEATVQQAHPALRVGCGAAINVEINGTEQLVIIQEVERAVLRELPNPEIFDAIRRRISEVHQLQVEAISLLKPGGIPKTSSGKIQRHLCRAQFLAGTLSSISTWELPKVDLDQLNQKTNTLLARLQATEPSQNGMHHTKSAHSEADLQTWMVAQLALALNVAPEEIDVSEPFATYGLDSAIALSLTAELSNWLGQECDPTLFWEYPTIELLTKYLQDSKITQTVSESVFN